MEEEWAGLLSAAGVCVCLCVLGPSLFKKESLTAFDTETKHC